MSNSVTQNEMIEIIIAYRYELMNKYKSMVGSLKLKKAGAKTEHNCRVVERKIARIDRVLKEVGR